MPEPHAKPESRKAVGVYDRPASADRPKIRTLAIVAIAVIVVAAVIYVYFIRPRT